MHYCSLYRWRLRSLHRMRSTLLSDMRKAWACLRADRLGLRLTDASTQAMSGVRTEVSQPGGILHVTEPSSHHCLTHRRTAFGDGAFCWFCSWWNPRWVSVIDHVQINSSTAHTHVLLLPSTPCWLNLKVTAYVQIPALRDTLAEKHVIKILKCFTISAAFFIRNNTREQPIREVLQLRAWASSASKYIMYTHCHILVPAFLCRT